MKKRLCRGRCTAIGGHTDGQIKLPTPVSYTRSPQPRFCEKAQFRSKMLRGDPFLPPGCPRSPRGGGTAQGREGQSHTARRGHSHSLHGTAASGTGRVLKVQTPKLEPYSWLHYSTYVDAVVWFPLTLQNSQARWGFFPSPLSPVSWTRWLLQFPSHTRHWTQIFAHDRGCK